MEQQTKSAKDIKSAVVGRIESGMIEEAINLFENHDEEVQTALKEYNTKSHSIMFRPDKLRKNKSDYKTNRLPRNWQEYINAVETYFLMSNGIKWELTNEDQEDNEGIKNAFRRFKEILKELHFNSMARRMKRIAGAETECAKLYACYEDEGVKKVKIVLLCSSLGYRLRPLFNRYGDLKAFAVGYDVKSIDGDIITNWDIYTSENIYHCEKSLVGVMDNTEWSITTEKNIIGKIPIIYVRQPKAWDGAQERIERDEWLDSKNADCNEYFSDPMLKISKNVKNGLADAKQVGKVIQVGSKDDVLEYLTPPDSTSMKETEKRLLKESILSSTFTPDFSYENQKGLGAISGEAEEKANILGYIKRLDRMEIYDEIFTREGNLIKEILAETIDPANRKFYRALELQHVYTDPGVGLADNSEEIERWASIGMSDEALVENNRNITNKALELRRLKRKREEERAAKATVNTTE